MLMPLATSTAAGSSSTATAKELRPIESLCERLT